MKVAVIASILALALSVSAGGPGGDGVDVSNKPKGDAGAGGAANSGPSVSGEAKADKGGKGGNVAGAQKQEGVNTGGSNTGNSQSNGPVNIGPQAFYGNGNTGGNNVNGGGNNQAGSVDAKQQQDNKGAVAGTGGSSQAKSGDSSSTGGVGGNGGGTGVQQNGISGMGGAGGGTQWAPTLSLSPIRRRDESPGSISAEEVVQLIQNKQQFPPALEQAFQESDLASEYQAPERGPTDPAIASQDVTQAIEIVKSHNIPQIITDAIADPKNGWTRKTASQTIAPSTPTSKGPGANIQARDAQSPVWTPRGRSANVL
ncbi:hypothetical protein CAC42_1736 [Sphaceloma murrayae]|uniref:Uncharacterized protein n=1 Tax=Sphaceloma murrayae TaxID=2082308 RepID=A0A2K1QHT6_9PEZI|nr:hypothetical protein CAC42_1736 [Sphaceloma murrayae]